MANALLDFGQGAMSGATAGATASGGNPYVAAGGAVLGGAISLFGGASERRLESRMNKMSLRSMGQNLEMGDMNLREARRADKYAREMEKKKKMFGEMLGQYFAKQRGGV